MFSDLCHKQDEDHTYSSSMDGVLRCPCICMSVYLSLIPRDIQSTKDKCSHRVWRLHYRVVRLNEVTQLRLEHSVTSICIIVWGVVFLLDCHYCCIFNIVALAIVVMLFVVILPVMLVSISLIGHCCFYDNFSGYSWQNTKCTSEKSKKSTLAKPTTEAFFNHRNVHKWI